MTPDPAFDAGYLLGQMVPYLLIGAAFYVYFSYALAVIARKTGTPGGWRAWVPIVNLVLMCRVAGKSGALAVLLLIPLVNLVVGAYVWAGIAKARGKPAFAGVLILVPFVNLFVPAYIAMGGPDAPAPARSRPAPAPSSRPAAASGPAARQSRAAAQPPRCAGCGMQAEPGDAFCGGCGRPLPAPTPHVTGAPSAEEAPPGAEALPGTRKSSGFGIAAAVVGVVLLVGGGWYLYANVLGYDAPDRQPPALPARLAGSLTEFPVDTDPVSSAVPTSVITQQLDGADDALNVPDSWMPPGVASRLPSQAAAITSTQYRTPAGPAPVSVHVIEARDGGLVAGEVADRVGVATGGTRTGVEVRSPDGDVYDGVRIQTLAQIIFILHNLLSDRVIVIYAADPAVFDVATRLAGNVGNGEGLNDYPVVRNALATLPSQPPPGLRLLETNTFTRADMEWAVAEMETAAGAQGGPELQQLAGQLRRLLPQRITTARYLSEDGRTRWDVGVGTFDSSWKAWTTWMTLRGLVGLGSEGVRNLPSGGLYVETPGERMIFLRKGPYLLAALGPPGASPDQAAGFAHAFQL